MNFSLRHSRAARIALTLIIYLVSFVLLDWWSRSFEVFPGVVTWYPPDGLSFGLLLALGARFAPIVGVASLISSFLIHQLSFSPMQLFTWAIFISIIFGLASMIVRRAKIDLQLKSLRDVLWLILTAVVLSTLLAVVSVSGGTDSGIIEASSRVSAIFQWWIGEMIGILVVTPVLLVHVMPRVKRFIDDGLVALSRPLSPPRAPRNALGRIIALLIILYISFGVPDLRLFHPYYLAAIPLLWLALDYGTKGVVLGIPVINFIITVLVGALRLNQTEITEIQVLMLVISAVGLVVGAMRTEQMQAVGEVQQSESRFKALIENSADAITLLDAKGMAVYDSPAAPGLLGYAKDELVGRNVFEFMHPDDLRDTQLLFRNLIQSSRARIEHSFRFLHKDGTWRWVEAVATNLLDVPSVQAIVVNYRDVTGRKQTDEALRRSERILRLFVEHSPAAIAMFDTNMHYVAASRRYLMDYALGEQDLTGRSHYDVFPEMPERWKAIHRRCLRGAIEKADEDPFPRADGTVDWVRWEIHPWYEEAGRIGGIILFSEVITERREATEQIQRQLRRLNSLREIDLAINTSFDMQVTLDVVLREVISQLAVDAAAILLFDSRQQSMDYVCNRGFRSRAIQQMPMKLGDGYASRAVLERRTIHIPDLDDIRGESGNAPQSANEDFVEYYGVPLIVKGDIKGVMEIYHRARLEVDQEWLDFMETLGGQAAIAIDNVQLWEQTQRHARELEQRVVERTAELNQLNLELEHANSAKDEFLASMSHELRTPLNSILGMSELLLEQTRDPLSGYQQKSLGVIASSGRHLLELINDILDLSKIEAGKLDFYPEVVGVAEICQSSLAFVKTQAMEKSIDLTYEEDRTVSKLYADPRRLKQILVNLLTNAVKFTPKRGQVTLQVNADLEEDHIQFSIIDNGIGIAPEDLNRLFQPFVQVDSRLNRQQEGTGLGLALVQKLTDLHGGSVHVESAVGRGSRFTINLPWGRDVLAHSQVGEPRDELSVGSPMEKNSLGTEAPVRHAVILLAEDNMANVITIGDYLESHGLQIVVAHNGLEAIEKAEENSPDIILMDIQMPAMDGLEATRRLRENPRFAATPIIALTALAMPGDRERCLEAGASEYMSKPIGLKKLLQIINKKISPKA